MSIFPLHWIPLEWIWWNFGLIVNYWCKWDVEIDVVWCHFKSVPYILQRPLFSMKLFSSFLKSFFFFCSNGTYFFWRRFSSISFHNGTTLNPSFDLFLSRHFQYFFSVFFFVRWRYRIDGIVSLVRHFDSPRAAEERKRESRSRWTERERENERMREWEKSG